MTTGEADPGRLLGSFIRAQRQMANLSLRQMSAMTEVSNPNVSAETLFEQAGLIKSTEKLDEESTERAIRADQRLTEPQRRALLSVYRSYVGDNAE